MLLLPGTSIVVLTMEEDALLVRDALQAGASGYVLKDAAGTELVRAIRRVAAGGSGRFEHRGVLGQLDDTGAHDLAHLGQLAFTGRKVRDFNVPPPRRGRSR